MVAQVVVQVTDVMSVVTLAVARAPAAVSVLVTLIAAVVVVVAWDTRVFSNICHFYRNLYVRLKCMIYSNI